VNALKATAQPSGRLCRLIVICSQQHMQQHTHQPHCMSMGRCTAASGTI
jgi:hypothetical protein